MSNITISVFGSKIVSEALSEIHLLSKLKFKHYQDLDLCLTDEENEQKLIVLFLNNKNKNLFSNRKKTIFPILFLSESKNINHSISSEVLDKLIIPFKIREFEKKIISLISKNEFMKNSLIKLGSYIIDKNERKIKKDNSSLKLSEKEINFLVLFSQYNEPITKNFVLETVWKYSSETETHTVETHIHRLRKKILEKFNDSSFIKNNNKGYYI